MFRANPFASEASRRWRPEAQGTPPRKATATVRIEAGYPVNVVVLRQTPIAGPCPAQGAGRLTTKAPNQAQSPTMRRPTIMIKKPKIFFSTALGR